MKSFLAACGAVSLLALGGAPAHSQPADARVAHAVTQGCDPAAIAGRITFCNPLGRSRGLGTGAGRL